MEKEAYAIVEVQKNDNIILLDATLDAYYWPEVVSFMFNPKTITKIKNKITWWKMELSCFSFNIIYYSKEEIAVINVLSAEKNHLNLHKDLRHVGMTEIIHTV